MKQKVLILSALFVAALAVFLLYKSAEKKHLSAENIHEFFWADSNLIDSLAIKYGTWTHLFRGADGWQMIVDADLVYPAAGADISEAIRSTNEMVLSDLISINPDKQSKFTVDTIMGTVIEFYGRGKSLSEFVLGKIGQDMTHTYVRRVGSDSVFLAKGRFSSIFTKPPSSWMDRQVFNYEPDELREVRWAFPDREIRLRRDEQGIYQLSRNPGLAWVACDSAKAAAKFNLIGKLFYSAFQPPEREHEASFESPLLRLSVFDTAGAEHRVLFAEDTSVTTRVFVIPEGRPRPIGILFTQRYERLLADDNDLLAADTSGT
jgi:hypothetical protein